MPTQSDPPRWRILGVPVRIDILAVTLLGMVLMAMYSVYLGKDINYDQRNYHYYGCYCLLKGRLGFDLYAAQFGSFLNPVGYLPFCWAVDHLRPMLAGILLGAVSGLSLGCLYALAWMVLSGASALSRMLLALLVAVSGIWSPQFLGLVGTSFTDSWTPLFILLGVIAALRSSASSSWRLAFAAGAAMGLASGIKLVNGVYTIALLLALCTTFAQSGLLRRCASYCAGVASAVLLVAGPWAFALVREFRSPFFPFFNTIFKSPFFATTAFFDDRWKANNLAQALELPFQWAAGNGTRSAEVNFRDLRFAVFFVLLLPVLVNSFRRSKLSDPHRASSATHSLFNPADRNLVLWFFSLSYLLWIFTFAHQRYATPIELLSSLAVLVVCDCLIENRDAKQRAYVAFALLGMVWVKTADWGRRPWGDTWFETRIPQELRTSNTLYVMPDSKTSSYLIPMLPADSRFVRIESNGRPLPPDRWLGPRVREIIAQHSGPLRVLEGERFNLEGLAGYGLSVNLEDCLNVYTYADKFTVCAAYRTAAGAASAVPLAHSIELARMSLPIRLRAPDASRSQLEAAWKRIGPAPPPPDDLRPRGQFDTQLSLTFKPPEGSTQLSGEVRFIPDRDRAAIIVDLIWYRGPTVVGRASPSTSFNAAGRENWIPLLMERPPGADSLQLCVRPWRDVDGIVTVVGGSVKWSKRN